MYKLNTNISRLDNENRSNYKHNIHIPDKTYYLKEDTTQMHIRQPNCIMKPTNRLGTKPTSFIFDNTVKHPKNGYKQVIESRNFYNDWKQDSLKYYSNESMSNESMGNESMGNESMGNESMDDNIKLYIATKPKVLNIQPMASNGSNCLEHIYNDFLNKPMFEYKRYANTKIDEQSHWIDNPLYNIDISKETIDLTNMYMINQQMNNVNTYKTVYEDMDILSYNGMQDKNDKKNIYTEIDSHINSRSLQQMLRS